MLLIASCYSDAELMKRTQELAKEADWSNVEMMAAFLRKDTKACFDLLVRKKRYPEVGARSGCDAGRLFREHVCARAAERSGGAVEGGYAEEGELDEEGRRGVRRRGKPRKRRREGGKEGIEEWWLDG